MKSYPVSTIVKESTILLGLKKSIAFMVKTNSAMKRFEASKSISDQNGLFSSLLLGVRSAILQTRSLSIIGGILFLIFLSLIAIVIDFLAKKQVLSAVRYSSKIVD